MDLKIEICLNAQVEMKSIHAMLLIHEILREDP